MSNSLRQMIMSAMIIESLMVETLELLFKSKESKNGTAWHKTLNHTSIEFSVLSEKQERKRRVKKGDSQGRLLKKTK